MYKRSCLSVLLIVATVSLWAVDVEQKRANLEMKSQGLGDGSKGFSHLNKVLLEKKDSLKAFYKDLHAEYEILVAENTPDDSINEIFKEKKQTLAGMQEEIKKIEEEWKTHATASLSQETEGLWHQPDTTIGQLVIDYGSTEYIWLMPPEIANLKIHVSSQLSVPKSMWYEMLNVLFANNGIGVKPLNTFMRQLYYLKLNQTRTATICDSRDELSLYSQDSRVCFILQPPATELRRVFQFLERFVPQEQMHMQAINNNIVLTGYVREVLEMLKVYDFVVQPKQQQEYRLITLQKAQSEEVSKILLSIFEVEAMKSLIEVGSDRHKPGSHSMPFGANASDSASGFRVVALKNPAQSLFILGRSEQLDKAQSIVQDIESKIGEVQDKVVYWYACKHSEAEELADVLSQVYNKIVTSPDAFSVKGGKGRKTIDIRERSYSRQSDSESRLVVNPPKINPSDSSQAKKSYEKHDNFIVDPKTNSIVIVVESYVLPKLKELLKKLDVPKKMVQIDVLLFEKRVSDNNSFGLNLLKLGDAASGKHKGSLAWNTSAKHHSKKKHHEDGGDGKGILQFLLSRGKNGSIPAYDLAYNFLLAQEDIQINANPTVTCVNQTPAKIAVVEQISINTGVVEIDTTAATRLKDSYSREEYGIIIQMTPTVHAKVDDESDEETGPKFIHLATDVVFDTTKPSKDNRPDVTRRNIKNEVRVADGETVILGGLRRKIAHDNQEMIPFLGELPGLGKLFSTTTMTDSTTEMFIFITPRIVPDPIDEYRKLRREAIMTRPGDIPEFLEELNQAQLQEKHRLFEKSIKLLLGRGDANPVVNSNQAARTS